MLSFLFSHVFLIISDWSFWSMTMQFSQLSNSSMSFLSSRRLFWSFASASASKKEPASFSGHTENRIQHEGKATGKAFNRRPFYDMISLQFIVSIVILALVGGYRENFSSRRPIRQGESNIELTTYLL